jgi:hypothetical protein
LFKHEGVAPVFVALEIVRRGLSAQIAIDALVINVILAGNVLRVFVCYISHKIFVSKSSDQY